MAFVSNVGGAGNFRPISARDSQRAFDQLPAEVRAVIRNAKSNVACDNVLEAWRIRQRRGGVSAQDFAEECLRAEAKIMAWSTRETYGAEHPETREYEVMKAVRR